MTEVASAVSYRKKKIPSLTIMKYMKQLQYHPTRNHTLLSGSTDGLVNIYDTRIADENDALCQVINHGSVHHAGFLDDRTVYALSHDEVFSIYPVTDPDDHQMSSDEDQQWPIQFGNLREPLGCEYVAQLWLGSAGQPYVAAGNKAYVLYPNIVFYHPSYH